MNYILADHAPDALEKRRIVLGWVECALDAPEATKADLLDPDLEHRLARIPEWG